MNNILEMKKHKMQQRPATLHNPIKEEEDFNRFMWKYLGYIFVFVFGLGIGLWTANAFACGGEEPVPMEPIKVVRGI